MLAAALTSEGANTVTPVAPQRTLIGSTAKYTHIAWSRTSHIQPARPTPSVCLISWCNWSSTALSFPERSWLSVSLTDCHSSSYQSPFTKLLIKCDLYQQSDGFLTWFQCRLFFRNRWFISLFTCFYSKPLCEFHKWSYWWCVLCFHERLNMIQRRSSDRCSHITFNCWLCFFCLQTLKFPWASASVAMQPEEWI